MDLDFRQYIITQPQLRLALIIYSGYTILIPGLYLLRTGSIIPLSKQVLEMEKLLAW